MMNVIIFKDRVAGLLGAGANEATSHCFAFCVESCYSCCAPARSAADGANSDPDLELGGASLLGPSLWGTVAAVLVLTGGAVSGARSLLPVSFLSYFPGAVPSGEVEMMILTLKVLGEPGRHPSRQPSPETW